MWAKAVRASWRLVASESTPSAFSSSITCWYCDGWVRMPTSLKFLAAARIIAGPPMSMSSSARLAPCSKLVEARAERVEVGHDEVDRVDAVLGHVLLVVGVAAVGEDPAVHLRVQRHHPVSEDRGEAGELGDVGDGDVGVTERLGRAAAGDEVPSHAAQLPGELDDPGLVVHGEQRPHRWSTSLSRSEGSARTARMVWG